MFVPVVDIEQKPLMPTTPARARKWIKSGKATPFWKKGIFCVRLNQEPSDRALQEIAVGIDPGSKKEGYTVKSEDHTYLNIQADAVTWVKKRIEIRRMMRRTRRNRKTPYRANKKNKKRGGLAPSTKARWQWKLRIAAWLKKLFPITVFVVEDIKARTKGQRRWDRLFSPLEVGKRWFYSELEKIALVETKRGWETKNLRDTLGLKKSRSKLANTFESHCVDSWVLADFWTGGNGIVDNKNLLLISPLQFCRRQLHYLQPRKNNIRKRYGGTQSLGFKKGSLIKHPKWGLAYVGGFSENRISLHRLSDNKRLCQNAKLPECKFLTYNSWRAHLQ